MAERRHIVIVVALILVIGLSLWFATRATLRHINGSVVFNDVASIYIDSVITQLRRGGTPLIGTPEQQSSRPAVSWPREIVTQLSSGEVKHRDRVDFAPPLRLGPVPFIDNDGYREHTATVDYQIGAHWMRVTARVARDVDGRYWLHDFELGRAVAERELLFRQSENRGHYVGGGLSR